MSSLLFECSICSEDYNSNSKVPMSLPCGHTVCLSCLRKLLEERNKRCPQCRVAFPKGKLKVEAFRRNYFALDAISDRDARVYGICDIHSEPKIWACLTDKKKICQACYEDGTHKKHKVEAMDNILEQANQKKSKLESKLKDIENSVQQTFDLLKEEENAASKLLQAKYEEGLTMMNKRQQEIKSFIKDFFGLQKTETINAFEADLCVDKIKDSLDYKIIVLTNPSSEEKFFHVLEEPDLDISIIKQKQDELKKEAQDLQEKIKNYYESCFSKVDSLMQTLDAKLHGKQQSPSLHLCSVQSSSAPAIKESDALQTDSPNIEITHVFEFGSSDQKVYVTKPQHISKKMNNALDFYELGKAVELTIEFQPGLGDEDVISFFMNVFGKVRTIKLTRLHLNFFKTQITEKSVELLFDYLVNFKNISRLHFCLQETAQELTWIVVNSLAKSLEFPGFRPYKVTISSGLKLDNATQVLVEKMKKIRPKMVFKHQSTKCLFH